MLLLFVTGSGHSRHSRQSGLFPNHSAKLSQHRHRPSCISKNNTEKYSNMLGGLLNPNLTNIQQSPNWQSNKKKMSYCILLQTTIHSPLNNAGSQFYNVLHLKITDCTMMLQHNVQSNQLSSNMEYVICT